MGLGELAAIGGGGAAGALARHGLGQALRAWLPQALAPAATLAVNVSGCLAMGALMAWIERGSPGHRAALLVGAVGFLGSYTTFSAFAYETDALWRAALPGQAALNIALQVGLGLGAMILGRALAGH